MILSDNNTYCNAWDSTPSVLPPRSRLYCLEPIGIGTPMVESLSGYAARLAEAHSTSMALLFGWELIPHLKIPGILKKLSSSNKSMILATSFRSVLGAMNGIGVTAQRWIDALETVTMRRNLSHLTMIMWGDVISHGHLLRRMHAWCSACYEERRSNDQTVYEPLLWKLKIITACIKHRRRLRINCHHCGSYVYHLASHSRPGFCSTCCRWLGVPLAANMSREEELLKEELEHQSKLFLLTGEMIAAIPHLSHKPSKRAIADSTVYCVEGAGEGKVISLSNKYKFSKQTLGNWQRGEQVPRLESLITLCLQLGISSLGFATGSLTSKSFTSEAKEVENVPNKRSGNALPTEYSNTSRRHRKLNLKEVEANLQAALQELIPPSQIEVARRMDTQPSTLRYHFADLCKAIVKRHSVHYKICKGKEWRSGKRALLNALASNKNPSVIDVARRIGWNLNKLLRRFPDLCKRVADRHEEGHRRHWEEIERELKDALNEEQPLPMYQVAKRLRYSAACLYEHFPDLCREIGRRQLRYRKEVFKKRRMQLLADIRKSALTLHAEGIYPSVKRVEEQLEIPISLRSSVIGLQLLREIRVQLSLDSHRHHSTKF